VWERPNKQQATDYARWQSRNVQNGVDLLLPSLDLIVVIVAGVDDSPC